MVLLSRVSSGGASGTRVASLPAMAGFITVINSGEPSLPRSESVATGRLVGRAYAGEPATRVGLRPNNASILRLSIVIASSIEFCDATPQEELRPDCITLPPAWRGYF